MKIGTRIDNPAPIIDPQNLPQPLNNIGTSVIKQWAKLMVAMMQLILVYIDNK